MARRELDERLGGTRVAVRELADSRALELVSTVGPITATSANHSGVEPLYNTKQAAAVLGLGNECVVDGDCPGGAPSTIISIEKTYGDDLEFTVSIMREGVIPRSDVETWMRNYH